MFRVIQLFVFVFGRRVHRTIHIRPNSLKPLFGTSLVALIKGTKSNDLCTVVPLTGGTNV